MPHIIILPNLASDEERTYVFEVLKKAAEIMERMGITDKQITIVCSFEVPPNETEGRPK